MPERLDPSEMSVVILAGGFGTPMGRDSDGLPKPLVLDTYRELKHLNDLWESGEAPWKVWP